MVMEDKEQPAAPIRESSAPEVVERPLWVLSSDEQRVLVITFVGGLASIIAGVCVIGGAIALVRVMKASHFSLLWLFIFTAGFCLVWMSYWLFYSRIRPSDLPKWLHPLTFQAWLVTSMVMWIGVSIVLLLTWIGLAAGIH